MGALLGLAYTLGAQLELEGERGFELPEREAFSSKWRDFSRQIEGKLDFERVVTSHDRLQKLFLLAALAADPSRCPPGSFRSLDEHIINRLTDALFGSQAPPPISLIFFRVDSAWDYLSETSSLETILGSGSLLRRASSLNMPLGQLAKHCHLRASAGDSFLSAAGLLDDCLIMNTCSSGVLMAPSSKADAISDAVSRFVAVATLACSVRCQILKVHPIELAFGYGARARWFDEFAQDAERVGVEGLRRLGFDLASEAIGDRGALFEAFAARKKFSELVALALASDIPERSATPAENRYESTALLAHCSECWQRPASFSLPGERLLCEPCHWRVQIGESETGAGTQREVAAWVHDDTRQAIVAVASDPFRTVVSRPMTLSQTIESSQALAKQIGSVVESIETGLSQHTILARLSPTEALVIVEKGHFERCKCLIMDHLKRESSHNGSGNSSEVCISWSDAEACVPLAVHVQQGISRMLSWTCEVVNT